MKKSLQFCIILIFLAFVSNHIKADKIYYGANSNSESGTIYYKGTNRVVARISYKFPHPSAQKLPTLNFRAINLTDSEKRYCATILLNALRNQNNSWSGFKYNPNSFNDNFYPQEITRKKPKQSKKNTQSVAPHASPQLTKNDTLSLKKMPDTPEPKENSFA